MCLGGRSIIQWSGCFVWEARRGPGGDPFRIQFSRPALALLSVKLASVNGHARGRVNLCDSYSPGGASAFLGLCFVLPTITGAIVLSGSWAI